MWLFILKMAWDCCYYCCFCILYILFCISIARATREFVGASIRASTITTYFCCSLHTCIRDSLNSDDIYVHFCAHSQSQRQRTKLTLFLYFKSKPLRFSHLRSLGVYLLFSVSLFGRMIVCLQAHSPHI